MEDGRIKMKLSNFLGIGAISLTLVTAGCATPYQHAWLGGGFTDQKLDNQTYHVQFVGNGFTTRDMVHKYFMYRCAELTQQAGYKYFTIVPAALTGAAAVGNRLVKGTQFDRNMMRKVASAPIIIYGGGSATHWTDDGTIRMFNDDAVIKYRVIGWDAAEILDKLGPYVHSQGQAPAEMPAAWVFEPGHPKFRADELLPSEPRRPAAQGT